MTPVRPSSSPIAATMKSDSAKGIRSGQPSPRPRPIRPPQRHAEHRLDELVAAVGASS